MKLVDLMCISVSEQVLWVHTVTIRSVFLLITLWSGVCLFLCRRAVSAVCSAGRPRSEGCHVTSPSPCGTSAVWCPGPAVWTNRRTVMESLHRVRTNKHGKLLSCCFEIRAFDECTTVDIHRCWQLQQNRSFAFHL